MTAAELERYCFSCNSLQDEPIGEEGVCKTCEKEQTWYEDPAYVRQKLVLEKKKAIHRVQILNNGKGWLVDGKLVEKAR